MITLDVRTDTTPDPDWRYERLTAGLTDYDILVIRNALRDLLDEAEARAAR